MKKIIKRILFALILSFVLFSCVSLRKAEVFKAMGKVAIVELTTNKQITWSGMGKKGGSPGFLSKGLNFAGGLAEGKTATESLMDMLKSTTGMLNAAIPQLYEGLESLQYFKVASKKEVVNSDIYKNAKEPFKFLQKKKSASEFKIIMYKKGEIHKALQETLGVDGFCFIDIQFFKDMVVGVKGFGIMRGIVKINLVVEDSSRKIVWVDSTKQKTEKTIGIVSGVYDINDLNVLLEKACKTGLGILFQNMKMELDQAI